jgi:hypothetical protein
MTTNSQPLVFPVEEMPYQPADFNVAIGTRCTILDNLAAEEALIRFILACQDAGEWRGLELFQLVGQIERTHRQIMNGYLSARQTAEDKHREHVRQTLGIHRLLHAQPDYPEEPPEKFSVLVAPEGTKQLRNGFTHLGELKLLRLELQNGFVGYPTRALVGHDKLAPWRQPQN